MEVTVLGASGVPDRGFLAVSVGALSHACPLPVLAEKERKWVFPNAVPGGASMKVEVLEPTGRARLISDSGEKQYRLTLEGTGSAPMTVDVNVKPTNSAPASKDPDSPSAMETSGSYAKRRLEVAVSAEKYLKDHNIRELLQGIVQGLIREMPENPRAFVAAQFLEALPTGTIGVGPIRVQKRASMQAALATLKYGQTKIIINDDSSKLSIFDDRPDSFRRKCKIICTMGPACWEVDNLVKMIDAGMNIARLNFSHGDHLGHGACVKRLREAAAQRPDKPLAILLDTKGPEIRTGFFRDDVGKSIDLVAGQDLKLVIDYSFKGDSTCIALTYEKLPTSVKPGNIILLADGSLSLKVKSCGTDYVITEVLNNCKLGERKNCNLPGVKVDLPVLQQKDKEDLIQFGIPQGVDFIAASFVQSAADVKLIRDTLGFAGRNIKIISKIENAEGLKNFDEIVDASDAIMVARGDLGMEIPPEKVFLAQKMMIARCNLKGKPVVTATQMLESMIGCARPTRAEASDVANAVLDGTDCVMLSGETANGKFPLNAVTIMRRICEEAEGAVHHESLHTSIRARTLAAFKSMSSVESICSSAAKTTIDGKCPLILVLTETGFTARLIAKYRPAATILAITSSGTTARQLNSVRGIVSMFAASFAGVDSVIHKALIRAKEEGMVKPGDRIVAVHGEREEADGHSNSMKIVVVP